MEYSEYPIVSCQKCIEPHFKKLLEGTISTETEFDYLTAVFVDRVEAEDSPGYILTYKCNVCEHLQFATNYINEEGKELVHNCIFTHPVTGTSMSELYEYGEED